MAVIVMEMEMHDKKMAAKDVLVGNYVMHIGKWKRVDRIVSFPDEVRLCFSPPSKTKSASYRPNELIRVSNEL